VAVQAIVSGDDDSSAVLRIFQKWRENPAYDTGMVLVRRTGTHIYEGRILWMTPGRTAYWYVEGRDADGSFTTSLQLAIVKGVRQLVASGPVFYVNQRLGDDAWDGTRPGIGSGVSGPKRTIRAALYALAASEDAGRYGGVFVAPGEYHERLDLDFGPDGYQRFLEGDGTNRDSTIICGANELVEHGYYAPNQPISWAFTGQDSTWKAYFPAIGGPGDSTQLVVLGWNETLHRKTSIKAILDDSTLVIGSGSSQNTGELSGWFWQHDTLYVKRHNGQGPAGFVLHTGYRDNLIWVKRRNWRIANLTLRFAGGVTSEGNVPALMTHRVDPGQNGYGVLAGLQGMGSGLVVDSCRFYGLNAAAVFAEHGIVGKTKADSVTVANSFFDGLTVGHMAYSAAKSRSEEDANEIRLLSRAANIFNNFITGTHNGIEIGPGGPGAADSTWGSQDEIAYNTITEVSDDGIELDTSHCINTLLLGNTIRDAGHGISTVPTYSGPFWVFYNTVANTVGGGVKVGTGTTGIGWFVNNTFADATVGGWAVDGSPAGPVDNLHFRNNIMVSRGRFYGYTIWGPSIASTHTNDFNYDLMDSVSTWRLATWGGLEYSFPDFQSKLGWEKNGVRAAPGFVDSARFNWGLLPGSAAIGRGQRITGVNTSLDGPRYKNAPDIGAASALLVLTDAPPGGPGARLSARTTPNPFRDEALLEYALPAAAEVTARLYDVSGRVVRLLLDHVPQTAGRYHLPVHGRALDPGVYWYEVLAGAERVHGKLVLIR
jgi:hypothetical protein